jgi:dipeptide/tripeptide permease
VTTPAQDAPLVFPSVAFRPVRLLVVCAAVSGLITVAAALVGYPLFGLFFAIGMALGLTNALLVRRAVESITAEDHPLKKKMALNSATRLLAITVAGLTIAFVFRPMGLGVLFGLALFQVVLVLTTSLPVLKKLRAGDGADGSGAPGPANASTSNDG